MKNKKKLYIYIYIKKRIYKNKNNFKNKQNMTMFSGPLGSSMANKGPGPGFLLYILCDKFV